MLDVMLDLGDSGALENWEENALIILNRLKSEIIQYGGDDKLESFAARFASHPRLKAFKSTVDYSQAVVPTVLRLQDGEEKDTDCAWECAWGCVSQGFGEEEGDCCGEE